METDCRETRIEDLKHDERDSKIIPEAQYASGNVSISTTKQMEDLFQPQVKFQDEVVVENEELLVYKVTKSEKRDIKLDLEDLINMRQGSIDMPMKTFEGLNQNILPAREGDEFQHHPTGRDSEHARTEAEVEYTGMFSIDL